MTRRAGRYIIVRGFYLCVQGAVIREGLSTTDIRAVTLQSRNTVSDRILLLLSRKRHYVTISTCLSI